MPPTGALGEPTPDHTFRAPRAEDQRQGRGAALAGHVEAELEAIGARVVLIETSGVHEFAGQRDFYLGLGYREEARIRDFCELGDDKVVIRIAGGELVRVGRRTRRSSREGRP